MSSRTKLSDYLLTCEEYYPGQIHHWCPACNHLHQIAVYKPFSNGAKWTFGDDKGVQDVNKPTFSPSMNLKMGHFAEGKTEAECWLCQDAKKEGHKSACRICHYIITAGKIYFCGDCTHSMAGQTVDLPPIPAKEMPPVFREG